MADDEKQLQSKSSGFTKRIGRTYYSVQMIFNSDSKETLADKTKKLILREITKGNDKE